MLGGEEGVKALPEGLDFRQGGSEPHSLFPMGVSEVLSLTLGLVWRAFPPFHTHPQVHVQPISLSHTHNPTHARIPPSHTPTLIHTHTRPTHAHTLTHICTIYTQHTAHTHL